jgi:hypothetical protein
MQRLRLARPSTAVDPGGYDVLVTDEFAHWLDSRPEDDEPLSADERDALLESDADIAAGRTVSFEEIKRELGRPAE